MQTDLLDIRNCDCMDVMREYPDGHFDLAVVDPPYGVGVDGGIGGGVLAKKSGFAKKGWDTATPPVEYFDELRRVSKHQIIWGANHMMDKIMRGSSSWIIWDKENGENYFADAELAYTSHDKAARVFRFRWQGMLQGDMANKEDKIHPTQKPVKLYDWIFANYAAPGMKVLDTHLGSFSSVIAAIEAGMHITGCEIDPDYFKSGMDRVNAHLSQQTFQFLRNSIPPSCDTTDKRKSDSQGDLPLLENQTNGKA